MKYRIKTGPFEGREAILLTAIPVQGKHTVRILKDRDSGRKEERVSIPVKHLELIM